MTPIHDINNVPSVRFFFFFFLATNTPSPSSNPLQLWLLDFWSFLTVTTVFSTSTTRLQGWRGLGFLGSASLTLRRPGCLWDGSDFFETTWILLWDGSNFFETQSFLTSSGPYRWPPIRWRHNYYNSSTSTPTHRDQMTWTWLLHTPVVALRWLRSWLPDDSDWGCQILAFPTHKRGTTSI